MPAKHRHTVPVQTPAVDSRPPMQRLEGGQFSVLSDPVGQQDGQLLLRGVRTCFVLNGILTYRGPSEHVRVVPTLMEGQLSRCLVPR